MVQKKEWAIPQTFVQQFAANEYVAACGDGGTTYLFKCDAGGGASGSVYVETNEVPGLQAESYWDKENNKWVWGDYLRSSYHACGKKHEASSTDEFLNGYYVPYGTNDVVPVIIWTNHGTNTHCTTELNMNSWETAKS